MGCPISPGWMRGSREGFLEEEGTFQQGLEEPGESPSEAEEGQEEFQAEGRLGRLRGGKSEEKIGR